MYKAYHGEIWGGGGMDASYRALPSPNRSIVHHVNLNHHGRLVKVANGYI